MEKREEEVERMSRLQRLFPIVFSNFISWSSNTKEGDAGVNSKCAYSMGFCGLDIKSVETDTSESNLGSLSSVPCFEVNLAPPPSLFFIRTCCTTHNIMF